MKYKLITSLVTPFNENNEIDEQELIRIIKDIESQGNDGFVLGDITGEGSSLTEGELIKIIEVANKYCKGEIIVSVGLDNTLETIKLIDKIRKYKHDALMVIVPYYSQPNKRGIYEHFRTIANTFKEEKFIVNNIPSRTIVKLEEETLNKLIEECPNIVGLKQSCKDYKMVKSIKEKFNKFLIYSGDDKCILDMLKVGANGAISVISHVFCKDLKELIEDYKNNIENDTLDRYIKELSDIIFCDTDPIPIKYILSKKGYKSMNLRLPMTYLDKDKHNEINIILNF